jgi:hypothetical protein
MIKQMGLFISKTKYDKTKGFREEMEKQKRFI